MGTWIHRIRLSGTLAALALAAVPAIASGPGTLKFDQSGYSGAEGATVHVVVERSQGEDGAASVRVLSSGGSALAGSDYAAVDVTLNWAAGDGSNKTVSIPILDDAATEGSRDVQSHPDERHGRLYRPDEKPDDDHHRRQ